jgi:hypothetical protein
LVKVYDPLTSSDAEVAINTREYTLYLRDLQSKFGFDLSVYFMPISYQWWTRYLKYIISVRQKPNKTLSLLLSKKKIEDIVKNGLDYSVSTENQQMSNYYDDSADIYVDDGYDDENFDEPIDRQFTPDIIVQERPKTQTPGSREGLLFDGSYGIRRSDPIDSYDSHDADFNVLQDGDMNKSVFIDDNTAFAVEFDDGTLPLSARENSSSEKEKSESIASIDVIVPVVTSKIMCEEQQVKIPNTTTNVSDAMTEVALVYAEKPVSASEPHTIEASSVPDVSKENSVNEYSNDFDSVLSVEEGNAVVIPYDETVDKVLNARDSDLKSIGSSLGIFEDLSESDAEIPGPIESIESSLHDGYISDGFEDEN